MIKLDRNRGSVLVVDDDELVLEVVALVLKNGGYSVHISNGAEAAFEILKKQNFDVLLSDMKMPGASGLELFEKIGQYDQYLPVILMTGCPGRYSEVKSDRKPFEIIKKPFDSKRLLDVIQKAVSYHKEVRGGQVP
jgi:DNA-binding NtrC family response regulator